MRLLTATLLLTALLPAVAAAQSTDQLTTDSRKVAGSLLQQLGAKLRATLE